MERKEALTTRYTVPCSELHHHFHTYSTHVKITISRATTATNGEITASREPPRSTLQRRHCTHRISTHAALRSRTNRAPSHPCSPAQSRKRSAQSWTRWRLEPHDRDGSMSRSLRSAVTMVCRRSEDWMKRASRLRDVEEVLAIAQRVELGHPSATTTCLRRALGHAYKQGQVSG